MQIKRNKRDESCCELWLSLVRKVKKKTEQIVLNNNKKLKNVEKTCVFFLSENTKKSKIKNS